MEHIEPMLAGIHGEQRDLVAKDSVSFSQVCDRNSAAIFQRVREFVAELKYAQLGSMNDKLRMVIKSGSRIFALKPTRVGSFLACLPRWLKACRQIATCNHKKRVVDTLLLRRINLIERV